MSTVSTVDEIAKTASDNIKENNISAEQLDTICNDEIVKTETNYDNYSLKNKLCYITALFTFVYLIISCFFSIFMGISYLDYSGNYKYQTINSTTCIVIFFAEIVVQHPCTFGLSMLRTFSFSIMIVIFMVVIATVLFLLLSSCVWVGEYGKRLRKKQET